MKTFPNWNSDSTLLGSHGPSLPFRALRKTEIRQIYAIGTRPARRSELLVRGNYVAGYISCRIRKEAQAHKIRLHHDALRNVLDIPPELFFEILEYLHPIDLYNLMCSSQGLRSLLVSRNSFTVWRAVFKQHPDIPPCPTYISFPKWVSILFGPATCDKCGHLEAMVDFVFLDHLCKSCMTVHRLYDFESYVHNDLGVDEPEFEKLVRKSHHRDAMHYSSYADSLRPGMYSLEEINERAKQISAFLLAIETNMPNAEQRYKEFIAEKTSVVRDSVRRAITCNTWASNIYSEIKREHNDLVEQWKTRLENSGHHPVDVATIHQDIHAILRRLRQRNFSKMAFKRSLPAMQKILVRVRGRRLAEERRIREVKRQLDVKTFYDIYRKSLDRMSWGCLPDVCHIYRIGEISAWIGSEVDVDFPVEAAKKHIQLYIDKYRAYKRSQVSRMMRGQYPSLDFEDDPLRLAATVFECPLHPITREGHSPTNSALVGWDDFDLHFQCIVTKNPDFLVEDVDPGVSFAYNLAGSNTMKHLLGVLGLDPSTTLAEGLDSLHARVLCIVPGCPEYPHPGKGRPAMTLKECVSHAARNLDHTPESFELLSEVATESVIFHEGFLPWSCISTWYCRHCKFAARSFRSAAINHVKEIHSIAYPIEDTDYSYIRWGTYGKRKPHWLHLDPPGNYICDQCPNARKPRLWTYKQVVAHLRDKHAILQPTIQEDDCFPIPIFEGGKSLGAILPANDDIEDDAKALGYEDLNSREVIRHFEALPGDC